MIEPNPTEGPAAATTTGTRRRNRAPILHGLPTKLLYAEDDNDLRDMVADAFVDAGFDVTAVSSAESALDELAAAHFDIIVTDYNLDAATGAWLLENAARKGYLQRTAVLVLTSERRPAGVSDYQVLRKPIDFNVLLTKISDAVGDLVPESAMATHGAARPAELELILYVTSTSQDSQKALRNLHRALKPFDENRIRLTVVDVAKGGDDAWYQGLEDDRIIVTPTLVKKTPGPKTWIVGTLAPIDAVEQMLLAVLGEPERD
jgi:CheY-like chemotaxis protein